RLVFDLPSDWMGKDLILYDFDLDDGDAGVFLNGQSLAAYAEPTGGPPSPWGYRRTYFVPGSIVRQTNVLAIFGHQGVGGAGIVASAPKLHPFWTTKGLVTGKVTDLAGKPNYASLSLIDASGKVAATAFSSGPTYGKYIIAGVKPGAYKLRVSGDLLDSPETETTKDIDVEPGKALSADFSVRILPTMSLASADLPQGAPGWKLGIDLAPGDFSAASETFDESSLLDVEVPSNIGDWRVVPNDSEFVLRLKFTIPDDWVGKDLILDRFNVDDGDTAVFFNGKNLGAYAEPLGGPSAPWNIYRTYFIPGAVTKKTNVLAIFAHQGYGGAGITLAAPMLRPMWTTKGIVSGSVVDSTGKPAFAIITLLRSDGTIASTVSSSGPTNGTFIIPGLTPGEYKLDDWALKFQGAPDVIRVEAGKVVTLTNIVPVLPTFFEDEVKRQWDDDFSGTTLDPKWMFADVGDAVGGDQNVADGVLEVTAGGHDIWDQTDGFHFVYQPFSGDFTAYLRVVAIPDNRDWELGGLMIRKDLDPQSPHAYYQVSPRHVLQDKLRPTRGSYSQDNNEPYPNIGSELMPIWLKLKRQGTRVAYYWSRDPAKEVFLGSVREVPGLAGPDVLVGIAATSHDANAVDSGFIFDDFRIIPAAVAPPKPVQGDLNGDGKVSVPDATLALQIAVGLRSPTPEQLSAGDLNGDGKISIAEVTIVLRKAVGLG
ncbi:MAG: dockerin type I domain-containing protein, partial [Armatimonadota bacterium]